LGYTKHLKEIVLWESTKKNSSETTRRKKIGEFTPQELFRKGSPDKRVPKECGGRTLQ